MCKTEQLEEAAFSGAAWLTNSISQALELRRWPMDLQACYKVPLALFNSGLPNLASKWLTSIEEIFYDGKGHFKETNANLPYLTYCHFYRDAWLARASCLLRHPSAGTIIDRILGLQAESGGFYCSPKKESQGLLATAVGGLTALYTNRLESAERAANFIIDTLHAQLCPESIFYLQRHPSGNLIMDPPDEHQNWFVFMPSQNQPLLYVFGLCTSFLASVASELHQKDPLLAAETFYSYYERVCGPSGIQHPYSGKMGWAASLLYRLTGKDSYANTALTIAEYLIERQESDGSWVLKEFMRAGEISPFSLTLDRTAEFVTWLVVIRRNLNFSQLPSFRPKRSRCDYSV